MLAERHALSLSLPARSTVRVLAAATLFDSLELLPKISAGLATEAGVDVDADLLAGGAISEAGPSTSCKSANHQSFIGVTTVLALGS